ncbi:BA14K family protein [Aminobacter sp. AP02]|uniref:BA14K family protein n=1 Tax=Aminobacter sp. AP02 TaxID=2135737 RepID=UPI000D6AA6C2|nr:BA14K family protein [Aminobacter sp. AP02]PWK72868.1 BA14K-like protein [Aminobacter sp. AP02]
MKRELSSLARSGLVALGLVVGLPLAASAGPASLARPATPVPQANADLTKVQYCGGYGCRPYRNDGWGGDGWRGRDYRRYDNNWRGNYRPYRPNYFGGTGIYFNFGVPAYRYYEPRYYQPRYYEPRRVYRSGVSSPHARWCYSRYRSYRAWDNTFQPYNGPRQQCWSPYR